MSLRFVPHMNDSLRLILFFLRMDWWMDKLASLDQFPVCRCFPAQQFSWATGKSAPTRASSFNCIKWPFDLKRNTPSCDVIHQHKGENLISVKEAVVSQNPGTQVKLVGLALWPRGPVAPRGLRWVCFSFSFSPSALRISAELRSSSLRCPAVPMALCALLPGLTLNQEVPSPVTHSVLCVCVCVCVCACAHRAVSGIQLKSLSLLIPGKNEETRSTTALSLFPLRAAGSEFLSPAPQSAFDKGPIRISESCSD